MHILKGCLISFAMYSKIPTPHLEWKDEDMKYAICFFPLVGVVIGLLSYGWFMLCEKFSIGQIMRACVALAIPLVITGGIHIDGFMDTNDALHSYQTRERKLEILKDSHIGAFSVIMLLLYYLFSFGAVSEIGQAQLFLYGGIFFFSRIASALALVSFQNARKNGMLYSFSSTAHKKICRVTLAAELLICAGLMIWADPVSGAVLLGVGALSFLYYRYKSYKEFGGITGDLAGWFLCLCELLMMIALAVLNIIMG